MNPDLKEATRDRIVLNIYLLQLDNPLVAFRVRKKNLETLEVVACITLDLESYITSKCSTICVLGIDVDSPKTIDNAVIWGKVSNTNKLCGIKLKR